MLAVTRLAARVKISSKKKIMYDYALNTVTKCFSPQSARIFRRECGGICKISVEFSDEFVGAREVSFAPDFHQKELAYYGKVVVITSFMEKI